MSFIADIDQLIEKSNDPLLACHQSWPRVRLGEAADVLNGFAFKSSLFAPDSGLPLIRIRDLDAGRTSMRFTGPYEERYVVHNGALLVGMDGDFAVARWRGEPGLLNQRVCRIEVDPTIFLQTFVELLLPRYLVAIHVATSSQTVKHLSSRDIQKIPLPCPPLTEQRRIVKKLEELLANAAIAGSKAANAATLVSRLRRSILNAAYDGSLIDASPTDHVAFDQIATELRGGNSTTSVRTHTEWRVLKSSAVRPFEIDFEDLNFLTSQNQCSASAEVRKGDLLITRLSGSIEFVGNCALVSARPNGVLQIPDRIFRARVSDNFDPQYVEIIFNSPEARRPLEEAAKSSAGHQRISLSDIRQVLIPRRSLETQREIVKRFRSAMHAIALAERRIAAAIDRVQVTRGAILAKAVAGQLVPAEAELARPEVRSYELASVHLEGIRSERSGAPTVPKRHRQAATSSSHSPRSPRR